MGQALLGIGAGAAGAFGGAYDAARKNRQQSKLDDFQIQNAQRDAQALSAIGQLGGDTQALSGIGAGGPSGMPRPPMPQQGLPPGGQGGPPGAPPGQPPQLGAPPPPGMVNPRSIGGQPQNLTGPPIMPPGSAPGGPPGGGAMMPQPTMPFPRQQAPSAGLTPAQAPGGGPPSSSPPPGGSRGQMPQSASGIRWDQAMQMIHSKNPGIKPDVLTRATDMFMKQFATPQNLMDWREQQIQYREDQLRSREGIEAAKLRSRQDVAALTDERIRDIAGDNNEMKMALEKAREAAAQGRVETQQAGATERTGMQQAGATERTGMQQAGATERTGMQTTSREGIAAAGREAAKERVETQEAGKGQRQAAGLEARVDRQAADQKFKLEVQNRNLEAAASRQEKALSARANSVVGARMSDEERDTLAKAIAEYRLAPLTRSTGEAQKTMARAQQLNPAYDATVYSGKNDAMKKFAAGPEGRTMRSLNVADLHLDTLSDIQKDLNNSGGTGINKIINSWKKTFGFAAPVAFDTAKQVVASEVIKAVAGMSGGGQKERMEAAQNIANHLNDDQFDKSVEALKNLLQGQKQGLQQQYKAATGLDNFDRFLLKKDKSSSGGGEGGFTGRTASNPKTGETLRETSDGKWVP